MTHAPVPRVIMGVLAALGVYTLAYAVHSWIPSHPLDHDVLGKYAVDGAQLAAALVCALGAQRHRGLERAAWRLIALGIVLWTAGDVYWSAVLSDASTVPVPSPADVGYLLFVPVTFAGLVLLMRARTTAVARTLVTDGITAALAVGALSAAVVVDAVLGLGGTTREAVVNLAYPVTDLILMGLIVAAIALRGWRPGRTWALLGLGTLSYWIADSLYLVLTAHGTYDFPSPFDFGWTLATVLYAAAAWTPTDRARGERQGGVREVLLPLVFALMGLGVLVAGNFTHVTGTAVVLATASLLAVMVRLVMTFRENQAMLRDTRHEAMTDALTSLGNRRALTVALERLLPQASDGRPLVLVLFDLDGFKGYNDSFGHPAGDELLSRLGDQLARTLQGRGSAYRMGGDEFCALIDAGADPAQPVIDAAAAALSERGEGFDIGCSFGSICLPREAGDVAEALRLADQRMYAAKNGGRMSAGRQSKEVLLRALAERDPYLGTHLADVASLACAVAERLGLSSDEIEQISQAAELHDIGKVAIPDAILHKPGPLDEREWAFIRRHTLIGERILCAAPALGPVGALVRSSHERFDGEGYPDGLAAQAIPLGSRIVAICDAFDAMVTDRAYRPAVAPEAALQELRRCAGTQFDPVVVDVFCAVWADVGAQLLA